MTLCVGLLDVNVRRRVTRSCTRRNVDSDRQAGRQTYRLEWEPSILPHGDVTYTLSTYHLAPLHILSFSEPHSCLAYRSG